MNKLRIVALCLSVYTVVISNTSVYAQRSAKYYKIDIFRVDDDMYQITGTDMYIMTRSCYYFDFRAILKWEYKGSYNNSLTFLDYNGDPDKYKSPCKVVRLLVETVP